MSRKILLTFLLNVSLFCLPGIIFAAEKPTLEQIVAANVANANLVKTYDIEYTCQFGKSDYSECCHLQGNGEKARLCIYVWDHKIKLELFEKGNRAYCDFGFGSVPRFQVLEETIPPTTPTSYKIGLDLLVHVFGGVYDSQTLDRLFSEHKATVEESSVDSHGHTLWRINVQDTSDILQRWQDINLYVNADHAFAVQKITCTTCLIVERPRNDKTGNGRMEISYETVAEVDDFQEVVEGCHLPKGKIVVQHEPLTESDKNEPQLCGQTITFNHIRVNEKIADDAFDFRLEPGSVVRMRSAKHTLEGIVVSSEIVIWGENNQPERQATWAETRAMQRREFDVEELFQNILSGETMRDAGVMVAGTLQQMLVR